MKFTIIASDLRYLVRFRGHLLQSIRGSDNEVTAICPNGSEADREMLQRFGACLHPIPMARNSTSPIADLLTYRAICQELRSIQPDLVLAYTMKPIVYGLTAAERCTNARRTALISGLGRMFIGRGAGAAMRRQLASGLYRRALRGADTLIFQNEDDARLLAARRVIDQGSSIRIVAGSGVDLQEFPALPLPQLQSFLMVARLMREKGVLEYLGACRILRQLRPNVGCVLAGYFDGPSDPVLAQELDRARRDGVIDFVGRVSDVRPLLRECSAFVLPSYREGLSRSILEALASARPVITTDAPGCRDAVYAGATKVGLTVPVGSASGLASAMLQLVDGPGELASMSISARALAETRYDVRLVTRAMIDSLGLPAPGSRP